jgi:hypothetical protein
MYGDHDPHLARLLARRDDEDDDHIDLFPEPPVTAQCMHFAVLSHITMRITGILQYVKGLAHHNEKRAKVDGVDAAT